MNNNTWVLFEEYLNKSIHQSAVNVCVFILFTRHINVSKSASLEQIKDSIGFTIEHRTLQRRLVKLKEESIVTTSGDTRSTRYHLVTPVSQSRKTGTEEKKSKAEDAVPLGEESHRILSLISKPENQRHPVGYSREFLKSYYPNISNYLNTDEKNKLANIGRTSKGDQPAGTYAREVLNRLLIDLSWNSSRLEGNNYSLLDTERLIAMGEPADDKTAMEAQMILNHKDAIEFIVQEGDEIGFNRFTILNLHALLSNNLLPDPQASGRLRQFAVGINKSVYTPLAMPQQIEEFFELILEKARQIKNPFEQAFFVMVQLPYLQPFDDVNKRVSRLAANIPLNLHNLAPLSFIDVPDKLYINGLLGVYELNRIELLKDVFLWAYERSAARYAALRQSLGEPDPFRLKYRNAIKGTVTEIVSKGLERKAAADLIKAAAGQIQQHDQEKFIEVVDTELLSLHEGNFARYWVRPAEFQHWKKVWNK